MQANDFLANTYRGKKVFVTGHTGFKGAWLSQWLIEMGAEVCGYSIDIPTNPSLFEVLKLESKMRHCIGDVRDLARLRAVFEEFRPEVVIHMAAQPLVRPSYDDPKTTFDVNVGGTVNVLECLRAGPAAAGVKAALIVTTDKCYENIGSEHGYRETDRLGGKDPYSASKAAAEIVFHSYLSSFFTNSATAASLRLASARAGNVIGGGDWAVDRIVPDCHRAWSLGKKVQIRNPNATRPWQHVLEALGGYLLLTARLYAGDDRVSGQSFNFGPHIESACSVESLLNYLKPHWPTAGFEVVDANGVVINGAGAGLAKKEALFLFLNCDKAYQRLGWQSLLSINDVAALTATWYRSYSGDNHGALQKLTLLQIQNYHERLVSKMNLGR